jgi:hypothetical protein
MDERGIIMRNKLTRAGWVALAAISMSTVFAGPSDFQEPTVPMWNAPINGVYIQGDLGYAKTNWQNNFPNLPFTNNINGAFDFGGALGYQWTTYLAAEVGGFFVSPSRFLLPDQSHRGLRSWAVDAAGKLMAPFPHCINLKAFFKAGIVYRDTGIRRIQRFSGDFRPMFALGTQYDFTPNWYVEAQWAHLGEGAVITVSNVSPNYIPAFNIFTFGAGYKFTF